MLKVKDLDLNEKLEVGYFAKANNKLLFFSGKYAFSVDKNEVIKI